MDLKALIAEADRLAEEPIDDPVAPEVTVEELTDPEEEAPSSDDVGLGPEGIESPEQPEVEVESVDDAESPDVSVDEPSDPESPDVPVDGMEEGEAPDFPVRQEEPQEEPDLGDVDELEDGDAPDLADDQENTNEPAVDRQEPDVGPVDDSVIPSVTEPASMDEPDVPASDTLSEPAPPDPSLEEPDVPDDSEEPAEPGSDGMQDPVGLAGINDLPSMTESEFQGTDHSGEPPGLEDEIGRRMEEQSRIGNEIASSIARELTPQFDTLRDDLQMSTQDFFTTQTILMQFTRD